MFLDTCYNNDTAVITFIQVERQAYIVQKRALFSTQYYETVYSPLPVLPDKILYLDELSVTLPYAEDFPKLHYHDRYEIGICENGEGLFISEGIFSPISKGDLVFIAPNRRHYSRSLNIDNPCICRFAYLKSQVIERFITYAISQDDPKTSLDKLTISVPAVIRAAEHSVATARLLEIFELCKKNTDNRDALLALKLSAFILESQAFFGNIAKHPLLPSKTDDIVATISEYLTLNYNANDTAKELAARCFISESQLRRRFLAVYGMPPIAYRSLLRCKIASKLLTQTRLTIFEISERIGYTSTSDFYRAYKKYCGVSPSVFRLKNIPVTK